MTTRGSERSLLADWQQAAARRVKFLVFGSVEHRALLAAGRAVADQIERGKTSARDPIEFRAHCERVLKIHLALVELAQICKRGTESNWPTTNATWNAEAWQNTYEKLARRISDGRVHIDRPLTPLARKTARWFFLSEHRRQQRFSTLTDIQLHRYNAGSDIPLEEHAEGARRRAALRASLAKLRAEKRLTAGELELLRRRYVDDWDSSEVAVAANMTADNVRQLCSRRCALLRRELCGADLDSIAA